MQPASPYEVYASIINGGRTLRTIAGMFHGRLRQARRKVGVAVSASLAVLECVVQRDGELEPSLDSGVKVPYFADAFQ